MDKITFAVENIEEVQDNVNSNFAIMKVDFFASGQNSHNLFVSEETLVRTAKTIYNVPVVWKYDSRMDDAMSHELDEYPCGFVKEGSEIIQKRLPDGRLMLSTISHVWKKYSGKLVDIFNRDKKKSISVEMSVLEMEDNENGKELKDYKFDAITVLGKNINPAIPNAEMEMVSFSKEDADEYRKILAVEFGNAKYSELDFKIPESVKLSVSKGLGKYKKQGRGGNTVLLSIAKHISENEFASPEKVKRMFKKLSSFAEINTDEDVIKYELCGGKDGLEWSKNLHEKMSEIDKRKNSYFAEEDKSGEIEKEFKEEGGENVEKENEEKEVEKPVEEKMEETPVEEKGEEEEKEEPVEEKMEQVPVEKMSLDIYLDSAYLLQMLEHETEGEAEMLGVDEFAGDKLFAVEELRKQGEKDFAVVAKGMFAKMKRMFALVGKMSENQKTYMSENEELKKFKQEVEMSKFSYEVESTLSEVSGFVPSEKIDEAREESKKFSIETIDAWKNGVKAMAFTFSSKKDNKEKTQEVPKWAFNVNVTNSSKKELWEIK